MTRPLRILLTADPFLPVPPRGYGGIERIVDALVRYYRARGHCVGLAARNDSTSPADEIFAWPSGRAGKAAGSLRHLLHLARAAKLFRPDVLHSFSRLVYLAALLPRALPKIESYQRHTGGLKLKLAALAARRTLRFTGCSEFICRQGRAAGGTWRAIPNFIEPEKFTFVPALAAEAPLVFLSRIEAIKGADLAIAIARRSGRRLILAGNRVEAGASRGYWERKIAPHLGHPGIEWIGEVDDRQKNDLLGRAAALLVPVQWDEPFGIVFAEALACGTPVLSCPRGALPEIVETGRTGFLFDSVEEGAAAVSRIGQLDRAACRRAAESRFSVEKVGEEYLGLYRELAP